MSENDTLYNYGRYDDMAFPYPAMEEYERDFPIHFPNQVSKAPENSSEDFWDSDPFFWSVTSDEEWRQMEKLSAQSEEKANDEDQRLLKWERAPLRHTKKKGWKNG